MRSFAIKLAAIFMIITLIGGQTVYGAPPKVLSDIKGHWCEREIKALLAKGIITGNDKGKYEPDKSITRAEFTALLVRAMSLKIVKDGSSFADANYSEYWGMPYIETAVAEEIVIPSETGESFFGDVPLKRIDMAVMMARALDVQPSDSQTNPYTDIETPNGYVTKLYEEYLMAGYREGGKLLFKPSNQATKAEAAIVVSRILEYKADPKGFVEKGKAENTKKQLAEERKRKAAAAGVSVALFENTKDITPGKTLEETNAEAYRQLGFTPYQVERLETPEATAEHMVQIAKGFVQNQWNVDYRTVAQTYPEQILPYIDFDRINGTYLKDSIKIFTDNKLVQKAEFYTSVDLLRYDKVEYKVRGTLKFKFDEPSSTEYMSKALWSQDGKPMAKGKWYERDVEITLRLSRDPGDNISKYRYYYISMLSDLRLAK